MVSEQINNNGGIFMKKRMRKWIFMLSTLLMLLSISACGKENQTLPEVTPEPLADWKTKGFQVGEEVEVGQLLGTGNYQPWEHGGAGDDILHISSGVCDNTFWFFGTIVDEDGKWVRVHSFPMLLQHVCLR